MIMKQRAAWKGLLRPKWKRSRGIESPRGLENIPAELVWEVARYLDTEDRAALALVSKTMLERLGKNELLPPRPFKFSFLRRLERDGVCPDAILCPCCVKFHSPLLSLDESGRHRGSATPEEVRKLQRVEQAHSNATSPNLPAHLHFNMVAAVMRSHRHGWPTYSPRTLATAVRQRLPDHPARMTTFTRCYVVQGRLILGEQRLVLPLVEGGNQGGGGGGEARLAATARLGGFMDGFYHAGIICAHLSWRKRYAGLFHLDTGDTERWRVASRNHVCAWTHAQPCRRALGPTRACRAWDMRATKVQGCPLCQTDFAWAAVDLPDGRGRVLALGVWKDLGAGETLRDPRWRSHLQRGECLGPAKGVSKRRDDELGAIYRALTREFGWAERRYRPDLDARCLGGFDD